MIKEFIRFVEPEISSLFYHSFTLSTFSQDYAFLRLEVLPAVSIMFNIKTRVECCVRLLAGKKKDAGKKCLFVISGYILNYTAVCPRKLKH
jgi:hypothetical protein